MMTKQLTTDDLVLDRNQGLDEQERRFGYIHAGSDEFGGFFFTWMPTLDETMESLDADTKNPPTFSRGLARDFLERTIIKEFDGEPNA
jgi:hypothetical protein